MAADAARGRVVNCAQPYLQEILEETETQQGACEYDGTRGERAIVAGSAREAAISKMREMADRLESGELWSARCQWRDGLHHLECVEGDVNEKGQWRVRLLRYEIYSPERPDNYDGDETIANTLETALKERR